MYLNSKMYGYLRYNNTILKLETSGNSQKVVEIVSIPSYKHKQVCKFKGRRIKIGYTIYEEQYSKDVHTAKVYDLYLPKKYTGRCIKHNSVQKSEYHKKNGKIHGSYTTYNNLNEIIQIKHYKKGKLHGELIDYTHGVRERYTEGLLDGNRTTPNSNEHFKNGKLHGRQTYWYPEPYGSRARSRAMDLNYNDGVKDGAQLFFHPNGNLSYILHYTFGELSKTVNQKRYNPQGGLVCSFNLMYQKTMFMNGFELHDPEVGLFLGVS